MIIPIFVDNCKWQTINETQTEIVTFTFLLFDAQLWGERLVGFFHSTNREIKKNSSWKAKKACHDSLIEKAWYKMS